MHIQSGCPDFRSVFGVAAIFLNRIETYKNVNISTLLCDVKIDVIAALRVLDLVFLDWHGFVNNEYI